MHGRNPNGESSRYRGYSYLLNKGLLNTPAPTITPEEIDTQVSAKTEFERLIQLPVNEASLIEWDALHTILEVRATSPARAWIEGKESVMVSNYGKNRDWRGRHRVSCAIDEIARKLRISVPVMNIIWDLWHPAYMPKS